MAADRRQTALSVFGVVQYRKREPRAPVSTSEDSVGIVTSEASDSIDQNLLGVKKTPVANSIEDLKAVAEDLRAEAANTAVPQVEPGADAQDSSAADASAEANEVSRQFDLRFWRCGNLLAVETEREDEESAQVTPETKHRLINNVFRAIFGPNTSGGSMYTHSWPDGVNASKTSDTDAIEWLNLFLKGQKAKAPDTLIWLMGRDALELLLPEQGDAEELEGMRMQYNKLDLEVYVTPSLSRMVSKPYLKAGAWKLLRSIAP